MDGDADLALGEQEGGEVGGEGGGDEGADNAAVGSADANGSEFSLVVGVLMESDEAVGAEESGDGGWYGVGEDEADDFGEGGEVRGGRIFASLGGGGVECVGFKGVCEVRERPAGCAAFEGGEGLVEFGLVEGESGVEGGGAAGGAMVLSGGEVDAWWVLEAFALELDGGCHRGSG